MTSHSLSCGPFLPTEKHSPSSELSRPKGTSISLGFKCELPNLHVTSHDSTENKVANAFSKPPATWSFLLQKGTFTLLRDHIRTGMKPCKPSRITTYWQESRTEPNSTFEKMMLSTSSLGEWKRSESLPDCLLRTPCFEAHSLPSPTSRKFSHSEKKIYSTNT